MQYKRRGIRPGLQYLDHKTRSSESLSEQTSETVSYESFTRWLKAFLKPKGVLLQPITPYQLYFEALSQEQQKNLIDNCVNQILQAHSDVVSHVFQKLSQISLDFGQKAEVLYRQKKLAVDRN